MSYARNAPFQSRNSHIPDAWCDVQLTQRRAQPCRHEPGSQSAPPCPQELNRETERIRNGPRPPSMPPPNPGYLNEVGAGAPARKPPPNLPPPNPEYLNEVGAGMPLA